MMFGHEKLILILAPGDRPFLTQLHTVNVFGDHPIISVLIIIKMISTEHSSNKCKNKVTKKLLIARQYFEYN